MKKDIIIKYTSHTNDVIPWLDEAITKEMKKQHYSFVGSGFGFKVGGRDLQFRSYKGEPVEECRCARDTRLIKKGLKGLKLKINK